MSHDIDIFQFAALLIQKNGGDASTYAEQRADEMIDAGDMEGVVLWWRIRDAISLLTAPRRPEEQLN